MDRITQLLRALADPTRLRIVCLLEGRDDLCVCELVDALVVPQYRVSRHLAVLKAAGLVADWRQGKWMHYALSGDLSEADCRMVRAACQRAREDSTAHLDTRRLKQHLRTRVDGQLVPCK